MAKLLLRPAGALEDESQLTLLALDVLCLRHIGPKYIDWDPTALHQELEEDFGEIGELTWERIQCARLLHANNAFWVEWEVFEKVCAVVSGELAVFSHSQPPEPEDIALAIRVASEISTHEYSEEVKGYMAAACLHDGFWYLDGYLETAAPALSEYDARKGIERDFASVAAVLSRTDDYITSPDTAAEIQANRVLSTRKLIEEYEKVTARQIGSLPKASGE